MALLQALLAAICAAIVGAVLAISFLALPAGEWSQIGGSMLGAAATAGAVLFTAWQTRKIFLDERSDERARDGENRAKEIHRALSIGSFSLLEDIGELHGFEYLLREALKHELEEVRFWHYRRALTKFTNASSRRLESVIQAIGDVEAQVCRVLIGYLSRAEQLAIAGHEIATMNTKEKLENGWTASLVEVDLKFIRIQRASAQTAVFLIDDYLQRHHLPHVPVWHNATFTDEQDREIARQAGPTDLKTLQPTAQRD